MSGRSKTALENGIVVRSARRRGARLYITHICVVPRLRLNLKHDDASPAGKHSRCGKWFVTVMTSQSSGEGLPLARVRRVMKSDDCIRAVTQEAGVLVCKATELFLGSLAERALEAEGGDSQALTYTSVAAVVSRTNRLDFLRDVVPTKLPASAVLAARRQGT